MTTLLEKTIEIEGIIRILRDGHPTPETYALLKKKATELSALIADLQPKSDKAETSNISTEQDDILLSFDSEEDSQAVYTPGSAISGNKVNEQHAGERKSLKAIFSLNDRYLYSRELFGGNMKMFDATLDFIEGVENYSDIEDYFYNELEWNPDNSVVATFLDTLRPLYKE